MAIQTGSAPIIVYGEMFSDGPRVRRERAQRLFGRATQDGAKAVEKLEVATVKHGGDIVLKKCPRHEVLFDPEKGSCIGCASEAEYLAEYVRMQQDLVRPPRSWMQGFQRELASAEWSRQLREKVRASAAADRDRELHQVVIDYFDD